MRKKKSSYKRLRHRVDVAHSKMMRAIYTRCVTCDSMRNLETAHLFSRISSETRWDFLPGGNCYVQCHDCNQLHERDSRVFYKWYTLRFGDDAFSVLNRRWNSIKNWSVSDLHAALDVFTFFSKIAGVMVMGKTDAQVMSSDIFKLIEKELKERMTNGN